ncbi:hypothetical protein [Streptomyces sp. NPDC102283]|uniref:hypothetical protein n=1 Tax=Streptomyces sp. NPDC102283 TaxID=3366155 RepID=UPI0037F11C0B
MGESTNCKGQQTLHILRMIHVQVAAFAASQPDAALADFEQYIRLEMEDFDAETEANKRSAEDAVLTEPLTGPSRIPIGMRSSGNGKRTPLPTNLFEGHGGRNGSPCAGESRVPQTQERTGEWQTRSRPASPVQSPGSGRASFRNHPA